MTYVLKSDGSPIDETAIEAALEAVNGRAHAFTIVYARDVIEPAVEAEKRLEEKGISKRDRAGARLCITNSGPTASGYRYGARSTMVTLVRYRTGWKIEAIEKTTVYPKEKGRDRLSVTSRQADIIRERAVSDIGIISEGAAAAAA